MSMVSNCCAAGADSRVQPVTGVVTRADPITKVEGVAAVRPNGIPQDDVVAKPGDVKGATLSPSTLGAVLSFG